jgi:L-ascorbate metabolism protein UlaG (beta-lactamase superfamily)
MALHIRSAAFITWLFICPISAAFCQDSLPVLADPGAMQSHSSSSAKATVTYIANEGFLIESGDSKILVDAVFGGIRGTWCEQPSDSVLTLMVEGLEPFDSVDVLLVTHYHSDHFNAGMVSEFMANNTRATLVCPRQVKDILSKNQSYGIYAARILAIDPSDKHDTTIILGDLQIIAGRMKHGSYFEMDSLSGQMMDLHRGVENIAYLIQTDSCTFLHSGDAAIQSFEWYSRSGFAAKAVDIAFMDRIFMRPEGLTLIPELIQPQKLIFMHIEPAKVEYYLRTISAVPDMVVFARSMETTKF